MTNTSLNNPNYEITFTEAEFTVSPDSSSTIIRIIDYNYPNQSVIEFEDNGTAVIQYYLNVTDVMGLITVYCNDVAVWNSSSSTIVDHQYTGIGGQITLTPGNWTIYARYTTSGMPPLAPAYDEVSNNITYRVSGEPVVPHETSLTVTDYETSQSGVVNQTGDNITILISLSSEELGNNISSYFVRNSTGNITDRFTINIVTPEGNQTGSVLIESDEGLSKVIIPTSISGWYNITVSFAGNYKGLLASDDAAISYYINATVKQNTTLTIEANPLTVSMGENITFTYTLNESATGIITFYDGSVEIGSVDVGEEFVISNLTKGMHFITATYSGDDNFNEASSGIVTVDVRALKNSLNITASSVTYPENVTVTLTAYVDGVYNVTIASNTSEITVINGTGSFNISLPAGNYTASVFYPGDDTYDSNSAYAAFTVSLRDPQFTASADPSEITLGESTNLTSLANATGKVTYVFADGSNVTVDVGENVIYTPDASGNITVTAIFDGGEEYASQIINITLTVNDTRKTPSMNVTAPDEVTVGDSITISVTLPDDADGNITYDVGEESVTLPVGENLTVSADAVGNLNIGVTYNGDDKYLPSSSNKTVKVNKKQSIINATITPSDITVGDEVTITASVNDGAIGNITYTVNGKSTTLAVGTNLTVNASVLGVNNVTVVYNGDDNYNASSITKTFTVNDIAEVIIEAPGLEKYYGSSERFYVTVRDLDGKAIAGQLVFITINGRTYNRTTDVNGNASMAVNLKAGVYSATVTVNNTTKVSDVTIKSTISGNDIVKFYRNGTQYYARFIDSQGNYLANGSEVQFNINGIIYNRFVSGNEGLARLNINLAQNNYTITAFNLQTGEQFSNNIEVLPVIDENSNLVKYYRNASRFVVRVLDANGNAVGANESVTFNINGVLYTRYTNESGYAGININLQPGEYIVTSDYKGCKVSNTITVQSVLSANNLTMNYRDGSRFEVNLVDGNGRPLADTSVTFNINGVLYNRVSNSNGVAGLNINLISGEYIITSSYNGSNIANTITVKP